MQINWVQKYGFNFSFAIKISTNLIWTSHIEIRLLERGAILSIFAQLNPFNFYLSASPTTILSTGCYFQTSPNLPALFRIWSSNCFKETKFISELFFAPKVLELWGKKNWSLNYRKEPSRLFSFHLHKINSWTFKVKSRSLW